MQGNFILNEDYSNGKFAYKGKDSHIFIKNKRYIDLSNCAGSQIIGHNNLITRKILKEISKKNISNFSSPNIYAVKFSKTLKKILPNFSKFIYCNSGSEAIMKGLRICRAVNSKEIIINTSGSWHGSVNETLYKTDKKLNAIKLSDGLPKYTKKNIKFIPYGDIKNTEKILNKYKKNINCILIEPIQGSLPTIKNIKYIKFLENFSKKNNIIFFLDEMITGLRVNGSSFQNCHNIKSDISTFGKSFGGGFPIGILAINNKIHKMIKDKKIKIFFGGTFSGNSISMFIADEITKYLRKNKKIFKTINDRTNYLKKSINEFTSEKKIDVKITSYMSMARIIFSRKKILNRVQRDFFENKNIRSINKFFAYLEKKKIYYPKNGIIFLSYSLTKKDLLYVITVIKSGLKLYF